MKRYVASLALLGGPSVALAVPVSVAGRAQAPSQLAQHRRGYGRASSVLRRQAS